MVFLFINTFHILSGRWPVGIMQVLQLVLLFCFIFSVANISTSILLFLHRCYKSHYFTSYAELSTTQCTCAGSDKVIKHHAVKCAIGNSWIYNIHVGNMAGPWLKLWKYECLWFQRYSYFWNIFKSLDAENEFYRQHWS